MRSEVKVAQTTTNNARVADATVRAQRHPGYSVCKCTLVIAKTEPGILSEYKGTLFYVYLSRQRMRNIIGSCILI